MMAINAHGRDTVTPEQSARQRRILFAALHAYMKRDALFQVLWSWENDHAGQPAASLRRFVAGLGNTVIPEAQQLEVSRHLISAMQLDDAVLGPDPMQEMLAYRRRMEGAAGSAPAPATAPANVVFAAMVGGFVDRLADSGTRLYPSFLNYVIENLSRLKLPQAQETEIVALLQRRSERLREEHSTGRMQQLLDLLYVGACEYLGPVKTDELLAATVTETERLAEARSFSPRKLL